MSSGYRGTFDDCQRIVKEAYGDEGFREAVSLTSVNSINWADHGAGRLLFLGRPEAGRARSIARFCDPHRELWQCLRRPCSPANGPAHQPPADQFKSERHSHPVFPNNDMSVREVAPSLSPSMDIQVSSNFERLLFELCDRDATQVQTFMAGFHATGAMPLPAEVFERTRAGFDGFSPMTRRSSTPCATGNRRPAPALLDTQ